MMPSAKCRSCRAPIRWAITDANNKPMPIDPEPVADGNLWVVEWERGTPRMGVALSGDGVPAHVPFRYVSHFVTCPDRDEWRKK